MKVAIPSDWDGETWCRWSICWPDSELWKGILLGFLTTAQRGRFWDEQTGSIKDTQEIGRQIFEHNFPLECVIMSCGDATELIAALNTNFSALTQAIQALQLAVTVQPANPTITVQPANPTITVEPASPDVNLTCAPDVNVTCGGGSFGPGGPSSPGYGPYGQGPINQPPANPGQTTPGPGPGGYSPPVSWPGTPTEYDEYKCKAANFLVDAYINYVDGWARNYENLSTINDVTSYLWAIFTRTPWVALLAPEALPVIGYYLVTLAVGLAISEGLLDAYLDYLRSIKDEWACDFYNAATVEEARQVATNYVGGGGVVAWPTAVRDFHVDVMFKNYTLNVLFEEYGPAAAYAELVDCSACDECVCVPSLIFADVGGGVQGSGNLTPNGQVRTLTATLNANGFYYIYIKSENDNDCCDYQVTVTGYTGSPNPVWHAGADCASQQTANYQEAIVLGQTRIGASWQWGNVSGQPSSFTLDVIIDCVHV